MVEEAKLDKSWKGTEQEEKEQRENQVVKTPGAEAHSEVVVKQAEDPTSEENQKAQKSEAKPIEMQERTHSGNLDENEIKHRAEEGGEEWKEVRKQEEAKSTKKQMPVEAVWRQKSEEGGTVKVEWEGHGKPDIKQKNQEHQNEKLAMEKADEKQHEGQKEESEKHEVAEVKHYHAEDKATENTGKKHQKETGEVEKHHDNEAKDGEKQEQDRTQAAKQAEEDMEDKHATNCDALNHHDDEERKAVVKQEEEKEQPQNGLLADETKAEAAANKDAGPEVKSSTGTAMSFELDEKAPDDDQDADLSSSTPGKLDQQTENKQGRSERKKKDKKKDGLGKRPRKETKEKKTKKEKDSPSRGADQGVPSPATSVSTNPETTQQTHTTSLALPHSRIPGNKPQAQPAGQQQRKIGSFELAPIPARKKPPVPAAEEDPVSAFWYS